MRDDVWLAGRDAGRRADAGLTHDMGLNSMQDTLSLAVLPRVFFRPREVFVLLTASPPTAGAVFFRYALWLGLIPPLAAAIGSAMFGWRLGIGEPVLLSLETSALVGVAYFMVLLAGFLIVSRLTAWMAVTYGASGAQTAFGRAAAFIAVVGTPLAAGGVLHLYPLAGLNLLALIPAMIWSAYLLYTGLPVVFEMDAGRAMLMATSILACLFVSVVALFGLTMILWVSGFGPQIGFEWKSAVFG